MEIPLPLRFINNIQFITNEWLLYNGFSLSIKDCIATKESEIRKVVSRCFLEAKGIDKTTHNEKIKEIKITASLSKARDHGMKIAKDALGMIIIILYLLLHQDQKEIILI